MTVSKTFEWDQIDSTDIYNVFHTFEALIVSAVNGKTLSKGKYYVSTMSGVNLHGVRKIREELEPTGEDARYIRVEWARPLLSKQPLERVTLTVSKHDRLAATVEVWGSNASETYGFMETTKNRVNAGLERSTATGWPLVPVPHPVDDEDHIAKELTEALTRTTTSALDPARTSRPWQARWQKVDPVMRHPLWSALIAGLIVGLIVLALTIWLT